MKKLVLFSMTASPHQVRFVPYLAKYFDVQHYFYSQLGTRQPFWKVELGDRCHVINCGFNWHAKYFTLSVLRILRKERPNILMLGGFSVPANILAYLWATFHNIPTVVFTERSRDRKGNLRGYTLVWKVLRFIYRKVSLVMVTSEDILPQFRDTFRFGDRVIVGRYPTDIEQYFTHPIRTRKEAYTLIFANRLTEIYNPIGAVEIFAEVIKRYPKTRLKMNASGELRQLVEKRIYELGICDAVEFLDGIRTWDDLSNVYASCDIMYLPAKFSNGNYTICECRASGMGCVISDRVLGISAAEVKVSGAGFVVPLNNQLFVEKICWYISHPEAFARETVISRSQLRYLTHEETAKMYFDVLNKVC